MRTSTVFLLAISWVVTIIGLRICSQSIYWTREIEERITLAKLWMSTKTSFQLLSGKTLPNVRFRQGRSCLFSLPNGEHGFVGMSRCDEGSHTQKWKVDRLGRIVMDSACLTTASLDSGTPLTTTKCSNERSPYNTWRIASGKISLRNVTKRLCLDSSEADSEKGVVITKCDFFSSQQFWLVQLAPNLEERMVVM